MSSKQAGVPFGCLVGLIASPTEAEWKGGTPSGQGGGCEAHTIVASKQQQAASKRSMRGSGLKSPQGRNA